MELNDQEKNIIMKVTRAANRAFRESLLGIKML